MKPTLTHMSRFDMKRMLKNNEVPDDTLIISINDTDLDIEKMGKMLSDYKINSERFKLYKFSDDSSCFNEDIATKMLNDVDDYLESGGSTIIIHCFLGISRSAAVAKWVNDYLKLDMQKYNEYRQHNIHVYDTLCKVSGVENVNNYYRSLEG